MVINKLTLKDFRQYQGIHEVLLSPSDDQNIILIGGNNGYGKTNLLTSLVWCLYGKRMGQVNDMFSYGRNYSRFAESSLNNESKSGGETFYEVSIEMTGIDCGGLGSEYSDIIVSRSYDVSTAQESFSVKSPVTQKELFDNDDDKISFIDEYVIPIETAKFVFFDGEKISDIAEMSGTQEGKFINDALNKLIGLGCYEELVVDLNDYISSLKEKDQTPQVQNDIKNLRNDIQAKENDIEFSRQELETKKEKLESLKREEKELSDTISSSQGEDFGDERNRLNQELKDLRDKKEILLGSLFDRKGNIPLYLLGVWIDQTIDHLTQQGQNALLSNRQSEVKEKISSVLDEFIQKLIVDSSSSLTSLGNSDRDFLMSKAYKLKEELSSNYGESDGEVVALPFDYDLTKAEIDLIGKSQNSLDSSWESMFEQFLEVKRIDTRIATIEKRISQIEIKMEDPEITRYRERRDIVKQEIKTIENEIAVLEHNIRDDEKKKRTYNEKLTRLMDSLKSYGDLSEEIGHYKSIISGLNEYIDARKEMHKKNIEESIFIELQSLMHKLADNNKSNFIDSVKVRLLPNNEGMAVKLYNDRKEEIFKTNLAKGEQQVYISALMKALIKEGSHKVPVFIDTPLGRLDMSHRNKLTKLYYPDLSHQVVLLSTDTEITNERVNLIKDRIERKYVIQNNGISSKITKGYFSQTT